MVLLFVSPEATAQSTWNVSTGDWNTAGNWSPSGVPTSSTDVRIENGTANVISANASSKDVEIGYSAGTNGAVLVDGRTWTNAGGFFTSFLVGYSGNGTLTIQNGGWVSNGTDAHIAVASGSSGTVTLTGFSSWTNSDYLWVGQTGTGTLNVQSGSYVLNDSGYIGVASGSVGVATVTGIGSLWSNREELIIGREGTGTLTVSAGGTVATTQGYATLMANIGGGKGTLNLNGTAASRGVLQTAYVSEGSGTLGATINFNGGVLRATGSSSDFLQGFETGDVQIQSGGAFIDSNGYNITINTVLQGSGGITKQGSGTLTLSGDRIYNGTSAVEAGTLANSTGYLGSGGTSSMTVSGSGSQWTNSNYLIVGVSGSGTLNLLSGGKASNTNFGIIGNDAGSSGVVTVNGTGSQWTNSSTLYVGGGGNGTLNVQAAGIVSNVNGIIGSSASSTSSATVTGPGSQWNSTGSLYVGSNGKGTLNVESGGKVTNNVESYIGFNAGSIGTATVTGTGSQWISNDELRIGNQGSGTLNILAGGKVSDTEGVLGTYSGSTGSLTVNGAGSQWINSVNAYVGFGGNGTLNVQAGGKVTATASSIGYSSGSVSTATVTGVGSEWAMTSWLDVGTSGNGTLNIQAGGKVSNLNGYIAANSGSTGSATVTGTGSLWAISNVLSVGELGSGTLNVLSGGKVTTAYTAIGYHGGTGTALVSDATSEWATTNWLDVGSYSNGTLTVQNGGKMSNGTLATIGFASTSTGAATVTGSGSLWSSTGNLEIGHSGTGTLTVSAAGRMTAAATLLAVADNSKGTLNLNGTTGNRGVLETSYLSEGAGTQGATINFNGGILRAKGNQANFLQNFEPGDVQLLAGGAWVDTQTFNVAISTILQGAGGLIKQGAGTLTLFGNQAYGGATNVEAGTLMVSGSIAGSATTVTGAGSTLGGTGTVGNVSVNSGSILQGGDGTAASGALASAGNVSLLDGSIIKLTLGGPGGTHSSLVRTGGTWVFDSNQAFTFTIATGASGSTTYNNIISGLAGNESGLATIGTWLITNGDVTGTFSYDGAGGVDLLVTAIPEPGSLGMLLGGASLLGLRRWRRR